MISKEAMSYLDLLVATLKEHEHNLSLIVDRLDKVTENLKDLVKKNGKN